ncbi:MAG: acyl-CoA desaturase [Solirubrobacterales bacterium]|nr:acyl-CoA desaturase [Solirubrobacterales bacterium]
MTRLQRNANIAAVVVPFVAVIVAIPLLWNSLIDWTSVGIMVGIYLATAFGITIGYHRLLTHRAFETYRPIKYLLAILGSMAVQGAVIGWVADHRKHHAHTDEEGDPHSPHVGEGSGLRGLYHAHVGWLFEEHGIADAKRYALDLLEDDGMRFISRHFLWWVGLSLALPFALGFAIGGTLTAALLALFWGGLVRIFFVHHVTWSINSVCHFFGQRRFVTEDQSTNVAWLALPSLGEAWHHNHHAFPRAAVQGLRWWEVDISGLVIRALEKVGLAWNVVTISPERQAQRLAEGPARRVRQPA